MYKQKSSKENDTSEQIYVTNSGSVVILDKADQSIYFNEIDMYTPNKKKLGYQPGTKTRNDIDSMNWTNHDQGVLAYSEEEIYFLGVDKKTRKAGKVTRINFKINKDRLFVKTVVA